MASGGDACPEHPQTTGRRHFRYCFHRKHHGAGSRDAARWADDVSRDEEFAIFDEADEHEIADKGGNLYGMRPRSADGMILDLGTRREQVAKFWNPHKNQPAHGFPLWPLGKSSPDNKKEYLVPREALQAMRDENMLNDAELRRAGGGKRL